MVSALSSATSGLQDASNRLDVAANNIANANTADFTPSRVDSAQLPGGGVTSVGTTAPNPIADQPPKANIATELLTLVLARLTFQANVRSLNTAANMQSAVVSFLA